MKQTKVTIPDESIFRNREKEAKFWEEHFDEAWAAGKPITVKFAKNLKRISPPLTLQLDDQTFTTVSNQAKAKGVGTADLIKRWIMEKVGGKSFHDTNKAVA